jgi:hypothetical protein
MSPTGREYQGYNKTQGLDEEALRSLFRAKYGRDPEEVLDGLTIWLVGPIPGVEEGPAPASRQKVTKITSGQQMPLLQ